MIGCTLSLKDATVVIFNERIKAVYRGQPPLPLEQCQIKSFFVCGYDGNQAPGCGAGIGGPSVERLDTSWVHRVMSRSGTTRFLHGPALEAVVRVVWE